MSLFDAIEQGDLRQVRSELGAGAAIDQIDESTGMAPLALAASLGQLEIVRLLLRCGADPDWGGTTTPLEAAALEGQLKVVEALLAAGADLNRSVADGFTPLMTAICARQVQVVRLLVEAGANPAAVNHEGQTAWVLAEQQENPHSVILANLRRALAGSSEATSEERFFRAIRNRDFATVEALVQDASNRVDLSARDRFDLTPLAAAAEAGDADIVDLLLDAGADPDQGGARSPLACAVESRFPEVVQRLLARGASPDGQAEPVPPLLSAAKKGDLAIVRSLLKSGSNVTVSDPDSEGHSALELAARGGHEKVFLELAEKFPEKQREALQNVLQEALQRRRRAASEASELVTWVEEGRSREVEKRVAAGAVDLDAYNERGVTLLMAAAAGGELDLVRGLIAAGAAINLKDETEAGQTALIYTLRSNSPQRSEVIDLLLTAGADIHLNCNRGMTPLMHAVYGDIEAIPNGQGFAAATSKLLSLGADLEAKDSSGNTVWMLVKRDALGASTLFSAQRRRMHQMQRLLEGAGAQRSEATTD